MNGLDTNKTVAATKHPSTHVNMRRVRPRVEKEFRLDSNDFGFICVNESVKQAVIKETPNIIRASATNLVPSEH